jgi:hypothetical protein
VSTIYLLYVIYLWTFRLCLKKICCHFFKKNCVVGSIISLWLVTLNCIMSILSVYFSIFELSCTWLCIFLFYLFVGRLCNYYYQGQTIRQISVIYTSNICYLFLPARVITRCLPISVPNYSYTVLYQRYIY